MQRCTLFLTALLLTAPLAAAPATNKKTTCAAIRHKARNGKTEHALQMYQNYRMEKGSDDYELLQQLAVALIEQGYRSKNVEEQLIAVYGAGISKNKDLIPLLDEAISNADPRIQLAALQYLADFNDDHADRVIKKAMASPFALIRLQAAYIRALQKDLSHIGEIEALMFKVEPILRPLFPLLYAAAGDPHSISLLRQLFSDSDPKVRLIAIAAVVQSKRDDLLPQIRTIAAHGTIEEKEAAAYALGVFKDENGLALLKELSNSPKEMVQIAALRSLYQLGNHDVQKQVETLALKNPYAITLLGEMSGSEDFLYSLTTNSDLTIRFNAAIALLAHHDIRSLPVIQEILVKDSRDLSVIPSPSPGLLLSSWKVITGVQSKQSLLPQIKETSLAAREQILKQASALPTSHFFALANALLASNDPELMPTLITLIENMHTEESLAYIKKERQRVGAPLVRAYCTLALFRLKEPGIYGTAVRLWITQLKEVNLISFRPFDPNIDSSHTLTPAQTSRFFIEALTAIVNQKDAEAIDTLLIAMNQGNPLNRSALAGILMRALE